MDLEIVRFVGRLGPKRPIWHKYKSKPEAGMWRYHANRMDARHSQFDLGRVDAYI